CVPRLVHRYFREVGSIFFGPDVIAFYNLEGRSALFTEQVFTSFTRMPSDCGFALTKRAYLAAGGYRREYRADGRELLGEGWRLRHQLDRIHAESMYVARPWYETSPRRFIADGLQMIAGNAYSERMVDHRIDLSDAHVPAAEELADTIDFTGLRRYVVRNYILQPCITRPQLVHHNPDFFVGCAEAIDAELCQFASSYRADSSEAIEEESHRLLTRYGDAILQAVDNLRLKV
ncbi:MAG: hypothetical protein M3O61_01380, partial [Gemmatimonadota bacterium]|nr:hypothetical protein [Gemmatimonadota bacterium]